MDHLQYALVLAGCVVVTLPLEAAGARVWRRPWRLARAVVVPAALFSAWDAAAMATGEWTFARRYVSGWALPGGLPVEEVAFFVVVPVCALLTFETVSRLLGRAARPAPGRPPAPVPPAARARPPVPARPAAGDHRGP